MNNDVKAFYEANPYTKIGNYRGHFSRLVKPVLGLSNPRQILDAGCGTGNISAELALAFPEARVTGVDFSTASVTLAEERFSALPNLSFKVADLSAPDLNFSNIDMIYCQGVLHHIQSPLRILLRFKSWLAPQGIIVIWLYNPFGSREVDDVPAIEQMLLIGDIEKRAAAVSEILRILERQLGVYHDLRESNWYGRIRAWLISKLSSRPPSNLSKERLIDRYLNPQVQYYGVTQVSSLVQAAGLSLRSIVEIERESVSRPLRSSWLNSHIDSPVRSWQILERLAKPRGLTYIVEKE